MDSLTHIYFAQRLLRATGKDTSAAVASLFPQIDRQPAYFHRMYGHPYFQIGKLAPVAMEVYTTGEIGEEDGFYYARQRYVDERARMQSFVAQYESETGELLGPLMGDLEAVVLAYASHTYQDMFNNPMQGFLPEVVYPSGQWALWEQLDAIDFRTVLYEPDNIAGFREEFFNDSLWKVDLEPRAVLMAMITRSAAACQGSVGDDVIGRAFTALEVGDRPATGDVQLAAAFLIEHEQLLSKLIVKYSQPTVSVRAGVRAMTRGSYPVGS